MKIHHSRRQAIQKHLIDWFQGSRRDLPWRKTKDPYAVLVSEIMLQQTQVDTVIPYFLKFMDSFPTVDALAGSTEEEVLRHWSGLGYYRRAKNLQACARRIVEEYDSHFPTLRENVLDLPGVGPYTAGAVMSIAFDLPEPLVDGNVERVLSRLFSLDLDLSESRGKKAIWDLARQLVPTKHPGDFNQSLMELGATVCKPTNPNCGDCVLSKICTAKKEGRVDRYPIKSRARQREKVQEILLLIESSGKWLVVDSNDEAVYSGLWQFPWRWVPPGEDERKTARNLCKSLSLSHKKLEVHSKVKHSITYRDIRTTCYGIQLDVSEGRSGVPSERSRWLTRSELMTTPLPAYQKSILSLLTKK